MSILEIVPGLISPVITVIKDSEALSKSLTRLYLEVIRILVKLNQIFFISKVFSYWLVNVKVSPQTIFSESTCLLISETSKFSCVKEKISFSHKLKKIRPLSDSSHLFLFSFTCKSRSFNSSSARFFSVVLWSIQYSGVNMEQNNVCCNWIKVKILILKLTIFYLILVLKDFLHWFRLLRILLFRGGLFFICSKNLLLLIY